MSPGVRSSCEQATRPSAAAQPRAPTRATLPTKPRAARAALLSPNVLSVQHWTRLLDGALYAAAPRVDWASLLRRTFDVDVLRCASCGGRLRVLEEVSEPAAVRLVLDRLGLPADAPAAARARDPTELLGDADVA